MKMDVLKRLYVKNKIIDERLNNMITNGIITETEKDEIIAQ